MQKILNWVKTHKFSFVLLVVVAYFLINYVGSNVGITFNRYQYANGARDMMYDSYGGASEKAVSNPSMAYFGGTTGLSIGSSYVAPQIEATNRKVVTNASMSLVVLKVRDTVTKIQNVAEESKGYVVTSYVSSPEVGETGSITVRVPSEKLAGFLATLRGMAVKVVTENIDGTDVTDSYVDSQARLDRLYATKTKIEGILDKAVTVDELMRVQQQVFAVQDQIDSLKGRLQYLDATSKTSLVLISLSTDELALPYSPTQPWRPEVIVKQASRSMLGTLRGFGGALIWVGVYAVIWVPAIVVFVVVKKALKKRNQKTN